MQNKDKRARNNEIVEHIRYDWLKNLLDPLEKKRDRIMFIKFLDLQTSYAYFFKIAFQRLW